MEDGTKRVLDVGQCGYDGPQLTRLLETKVGVEVESADTLDEAVEKLSNDKYDLVLVNRELAVDGASGLELIRWMKDNSSQTPVMLVSDKAEAQKEAVSLGAKHGFGKSVMNQPHTIKLLQKTLGLKL